MFVGWCEGEERSIPLKVERKLLMVYILIYIYIYICKKLDVGC